jgi:hypothetical protein
VRSVLAEPECDLKPIMGASCLMAAARSPPNRIYGASPHMRYAVMA